MDGYQLWWPEEQSDWAERGMLLLVAVSPGRSEGLPERALPCRIVGTVSPGAAALPFSAPPEAVSSAQRASQLLAQIGVPANLLGCGYLRTALQLVLEQPQMRRGLMRTLYPEVGRRHQVSAVSVERAIRHAIVQTWARGGAARYRQLLGRMGSSVGERPTNSEFITVLSEHLARRA